MHDRDLLAERFEANRAHLKAVAYRMLGSVSEADDAVQEAWLRLSRADTSEVENLRAWLTTVVGRVCLDMLRSRKAKREEAFGPRVPEPIISSEAGMDPEHEALMADSVGLALLVVLEELTPPERLAFVLHDMFGIPFSEIAQIVDRSPDAARQLASRARRRVRGAPSPDPDLDRQREVAEAFVAASKEGDFEGLLALLAPDVVLRVDQGPRGSLEIRGAREVAARAHSFAHLAAFARPVLVNGAPGYVVVRNGRPVSLGAFTVTEGKITEMDLLADPKRLAELDLTLLDD